MHSCTRGRALRHSEQLAWRSFAMARAGPHNREFIDHGPITPSNLPQHLKKIQAAGLVEHADRTERQYRVVNPKSVARLMTAYELATPDQVDTFIRVWGEFRL